MDKYSGKPGAAAKTPALLVAMSPPEVRADPVRTAGAGLHGGRHDGAAPDDRAPRVLQRLAGCCCGTFRVAGGDVCSEGGRLVLVLVDKRDVAESSVLQAGHTGSERGDARGSAVGVQDSPQPRYKPVQYELRENSSSACHVFSEHPEGRGARQPHSC